MQAQARWWCFVRESIDKNFALCKEGYAPKVKKTFGVYYFIRKRREMRGFFAVHSLTFFRVFGTIKTVMFFTREGAVLWRLVLIIKSI